MTIISSSLRHGQIDYVQQRKQFGKSLGEFQHTQFKLADMQTQLHASRLMVQHAARALDARTPTATADAAMAKRFATDACYDITNDALQLLGGYGYLKEYPVERCVMVTECMMVVSTNGA